ncbi:hypothetical protein TWF481_002905 [Arthrobotrys musiformis]|uniref:C2H2-type domain-containing protein n=1 Tax=Arthrobotrys musiformis TaxID=47236 RepID=A0AAV9VRL4_9PEZI
MEQDSPRTSGTYTTAKEDWSQTVVIPAADAEDGRDITVGAVQAMTNEEFEGLLDTYTSEEECNKIFDARHGKWPKNRSLSAEFVYEPTTKFNKANPSTMRYGKSERKLSCFQCGETFESGNLLHTHLSKMNDFSKGKNKDGRTAGRQGPSLGW